MIAHSLREDGYPDDNSEWNPLESVGTRADAFEYVMHGKIYRIDGDDGPGDASRLWVIIKLKNKQAIKRQEEETEESTYFWIYELFYFLKLNRSIWNNALFFKKLVDFFFVLNSWLVQYV